MIEQGRISGRQATFLLIVAIVPTSVIFLPHFMYLKAQQDAWLSVILVSLYGLGAGLVLATLAQRFPGRTLVEFGRELLGPVWGGALGLFYTLYFIYLNSFIVRELGELLVSNFYDQTPVAVFITGIILVAVYISRHGLEVAARINDIMFIIILISLLSLLLFVALQVEPGRIFPVLEKGPLPAVKGAVPAAVFLSETFIILMLAPFLARTAKIRAVISRAVLGTGLIQLLIMLAVITVLDGLAAFNLFPVLVMARQIRLAPYLYNIDPLLILAWLLSGFIKAALFLYCANLAAAQVFKLKSFGPLPLINGVLLALLALYLWEDSTELTHQINLLAPFFAAVQVGIPLFLLVLAIIRKKGGVKNAGS